MALSERKLRVSRPRLRKKESGPGGEVPVPAYEAMQADGKLAAVGVEGSESKERKSKKHVLGIARAAVG